MKTRYIKSRNCIEMAIIFEKQPIYDTGKTEVISIPVSKKNSYTLAQRLPNLILILR